MIRTDMISTIGRPYLTSNIEMMSLVIKKHFHKLNLTFRLSGIVRGVLMKGLILGL